MIPRIIYFDTPSSLGEIDITVFETTQLSDFKINRVFWLTNAVKGQERGDHAHKKSLHIILALKGKIEVVLQSQVGKSQAFVLDTPQKGLIVPPNYWRVLRYIGFETVQLVVSSTFYDPDDYILDYEEFLRHHYL